MDAGKSLISIVTPCWNEEDSIEDCYNAVRRIIEEQLPDCDYEHIFSDNCSSDATVPILKRLAAQDHRVKVIVNARNFGPLNSNFNALMAATGDAVVVFLPVDLQDPPEVIPGMVARWREGYEVVFGIRQEREEGWLLRTVRRVYYRLVGRVAGLTNPGDGGGVPLLAPQVVDA